eukprot:SM000566S18622  [mRNA]  locus=s566:82:1600:+ [translate_table: standard]
MSTQQQNLAGADQASLDAGANGAVDGGVASGAFTSKLRSSKLLFKQHAKMLRLGLVRPEMVSWSPRVMVLHDFLSHEECDHLIGLAKNKLEPALVLDEETGKSVSDEWRNSSYYFATDNEEQHPMVQPILQRISYFAQLPPKNGESLQPNGDVDSQAIHAGCKVLAGEKWTATKWICTESLDSSSLPEDEATPDTEEAPS